jgi:hypothetical protein
MTGVCVGQFCQESLVSVIDPLLGYNRRPTLRFEMIRNVLSE